MNRKASRSQAPSVNSITAPAAAAPGMADAEAAHAEETRRAIARYQEAQSRRVDAYQRYEAFLEANNVARGTTWNDPVHSVARRWETVLDGMAREEGAAARLLVLAIRSWADFGEPPVKAVQSDGWLFVDATDPEDEADPQAKVDWRVVAIPIDRQFVNLDALPGQA